MKADIAASPFVSQLFNWSRPKYLLFAFIGLMYAYVLWNNESFLFKPSDSEWPHIESFKWFLLPHGLAAGCALFLGPLQFSDRLRRRFAKAHRVLGRFYVAGVVVGAPIGLYIQHYEEVHMYASDPTAHSLTFAASFQAGIWSFCTLMALAFILLGKVQLHRQWMTRSFACALIFIEARVVAGVFNWGHFIEIIVWGCVAAAVPLADLALYCQEFLLTRSKPAKTAKAAAYIGSPVRENW